jgi:hypothetical protein
MRLTAAALVLPLVAFAMMAGGSWLRCRTTGEVLSACCCDGGEASPTPKTDAVGAADCCDRISQTVTPAPVELAAATDLTPLPGAALASVTADLDASSDSSATPARLDVRSSVGPPAGRALLVAKSTFLI